MSIHAHVKERGEGVQTTPHKKRILVAVAEDSVARMAGMLGTDHEVRWARTVHQAQSHLRSEHFDLILCGARFDDSRLLDLLQFCKSRQVLAAIPFLCLRIKRGKLPLDTFRDLVLASNALGAAGFVDLEQWDRQLGTDQTDQDFRHLLQAHLGD